MGRHFITIAGISYKMFRTPVDNPHTAIRMHKTGIFMYIPVIIPGSMCQSQTIRLTRCFCITICRMLMIEPGGKAALAINRISRMIMVCILYFSRHLFCSDYYFLRHCKNCLLQFSKSRVIGNCNIFSEQRSCQQFFTVTHRLKNRLQ